MKNNKILFIGMIMLLFLFLIISYVVIVNMKVQEERLFHDVDRFSSQDFLYDRFFSSSTVAGTYQEVEELIEDYVQSFYGQYQKVMDYADDQRLISLLSVSNYIADGPGFDDSINYVQSIRNDFQKDIDTLLLFCGDKSVRDFAKKSTLSNYHQELFVSSVNIFLFSKLKDYRTSFLQIEQQMNDIFDTVIQTFLFLRVNTSEWKIEGNQIQFSTEDLVTQYNNLVANISYKK